jgi:CRISPR-associated exonuclease Cas4
VENRLSEECEKLEPVMISALEHYSYCPRQCALIHLDQIFEENIYTLRGRIIHERVDEGDSSVEDSIRVTRAVPLWSKRHGLVGKADVIEFHGETPYPVDYKLAPRRKHPHAALQLCGQALCLEEMFEKEVPCGAIYHHGSRRRQEVIFDDSLRERVKMITREIRNVLASEKLPKPVNDLRCQNCSLKESCLPSVVGEKDRLIKLARELFTPMEPGK